MKIDIDKIKAEKTMEELLDFSIINIDKPSGPTSFGVDVIIKKALNASKTSHFGTLDPMVTGVLPIALNRACRLMGSFIGKNKTYVGIMKLHEDITLEKLKEEIKPFLGTITQLPPVKSRVKRIERERTIYTFKILEKNEKNILFETEVEAGTYIRKLIHDLGEKMNGAHMLELRRTQASIFEESESYTLYQFLEAVDEYKKGNDKNLRKMLIPGEIISNVLPVIQIKKQYIKELQHGSPLFKSHLENSQEIKEKEGKVAVFQNEKFIGIFTLVNSSKNSEFLAKPEFTLQPIKNR